MHVDPLHDTYLLLQRSHALITMSRHLMLRTNECVENTHRALQTSFAQLDRRLPSLNHTPYFRASAPIDE
jgi:hypothetical protein